MPGSPSAVAERRGSRTRRSLLPAAAAVSGLALLAPSAVAATPPGVPVQAPARAAVTTPATSSAAVTPGRPRIVVAISLDGLAVRAIRLLGRSGTPALHRMIRNGASTLNARTAYERTVTLPNHTGMLTGRRVLGARGHHVTMNDDPGTTVHALAGAYRASLFDVVHDRGGSTALYASKTKFAFFDRSWNGVNGRADGIGRDDGRDKIDVYVEDDPDRLVDRVVRRLQHRPVRASFVHIRWPDEAGHAFGWMSPAYLDAVRRSDRQVGRVLAAARSTRYLRRHVTVIVTADHGGPAGLRTHDDRTLRADYRIPFLVWGAGVARGANLYALNPERVRPGSGRPGYARPPIRNIDVASLVTTLLGHPAVPGGVLPRTTPLEVR